jgi:MFS family permease
LNYHYPSLFAFTLIPGLAAAALIAFLVKEKERKPVPRISFGAQLRLLPKAYRRFLVAVGLFGAGDFAHTLLILLATQKLSPSLGSTKAASVAVGLYVMHNVLYAAFSLVAGWLADRLDKHYVLAGGYFLGAAMAAGVICLPFTIWTLALVFASGGIYVAVEETLEDSLCAELVEDSHHGMAFGVLATVNGVGDFISSLAVGALWTAFGTSVAFGYSAALCTAGALVLLRTKSL